MTSEEIDDEVRALLCEAKEWRGTQFEHRSSVKCLRDDAGEIVDLGGVDCACFIAECFNAAVDHREAPTRTSCPNCRSLKRVLREYERDSQTEICRNDDWHSLLSVRPYYDQWHLHRNDELYLQDLRQQGFVEIERKDKRVGDLIISQVGRPYSHGAIIAGWPCADCELRHTRINREAHGCVIQAESRKAGKVTYVHDIEKNWYFQMNQVKFFRWGPWNV